MDGTDKGSTATSDTGASTALRTTADEFQAADALFIAVHRVHALGCAVQVLANPDRRSMPDSCAVWDGEMRNLEELGALIASLALDVMEPAGELLFATRERAETLERWKRSALGDAAGAPQ